MYIATKNNGYGHSIYIQIPRIKQPIPLFVLFRALGVISDKEICERIILNIKDKEMSQMVFGLKASIIDAKSHDTMDKSLEYIISHVMFTPINMDKQTGDKKKKEFANCEWVLTEDIVNKPSSVLMKKIQGEVFC